MVAAAVGWAKRVTHDDHYTPVLVVWFDPVVRVFVARVYSSMPVCDHIQTSGIFAVL